MATVTEALADIDGIDMGERPGVGAAALDIFRERRKAFTTRLVRSTAIGRLASDISARKSKLQKDFEERAKAADTEEDKFSDDDDNVKVAETKDGEVVPRVDRMISLLDDIDSGVIRLLDFIKFGPVPVRIVDLPLEVKVKGLSERRAAKKKDKDPGEKLEEREEELEAGAKEKAGKNARAALGRATKVLGSGAGSLFSGKGLGDLVRLILGAGIVKTIISTLAGISLTGLASSALGGIAALAGSPVFLAVAAAAVGAVAGTAIYESLVSPFIDRVVAEERRKLNIGAEQRAEREQATIEGTGEKAFLVKGPDGTERLVGESEVTTEMLESGEARAATFQRMKDGTVSQMSGAGFGVSETGEVKAGQIASLEERAKAMGIPLSYYRQYSLRLVALQENMMSLSGQIMGMAPGDERSKAERDLATMATEYEGLVDKFADDAGIKKEMGSKRFSSLVSQLQGTEFYKLSDKQNDLFGMSDADFAQQLSALGTDAGIDVLPSASAAALINAGDQNARADTAGGGTVILNQQRIDASQNQGDTVTVGNRDTRGSDSTAFESNSPGGF